MSFPTYVDILGINHPALGVDCVGDGSVYANINWHGNTPIAQATLDTEITTYLAAVANPNVPTPTLDANGQLTYVDPAGNTIPMVNTNFIFGSTATSGTGYYLNSSIGVASNLMGIVMPRKSNLISVALGVGTANTSIITYGIRVNRGASNSVAYTLPASTLKSQLTGLAIQFNAGDEISVYVSASQNISRPMANLEFAWRA